MDHLMLHVSARSDKRETNCIYSSDNNNNGANESRLGLAARAVKAGHAVCSQKERRLLTSRSCNKGN